MGPDEKILRKGKSYGKQKLRKCTERQRVTSKTYEPETGSESTNQVVKTETLGKRRTGGSSRKDTIGPKKKGKEVEGEGKRKEERKE